MSGCKHEIKELIDDGGICKKCGEWFSWLFWYKVQFSRIAELQRDLYEAAGNPNTTFCGICNRPLMRCGCDERIAELENQLASGVHTCTDTCQRPMCVLRRRVRELEHVGEQLLGSWERNDLAGVCDNFERLCEILAEGG